MKNRIITALLFVFIFMGLKSTAQITCPDSIAITANGKCAYLMWFGIAPTFTPNVSTLTMISNNANYILTYRDGQGTVDIPHRFSITDQGCQPAEKQLTGSITFNPSGPTCDYFEGSSLPIIISELSTKIVGSSIVLICKYESTGEEGFVMVERSDDLSSWESITRLDTDYTRKNNSFTFKDENPSKGLNYYKVSVVDEDGLLISEEVTNAYFSSTGEISLYPNPVNDILVVKNSGKESMSEVVIFDQYGRKVKVLKGDIDKIDFTSYPQGMYHIRATLKNGQTIQQNIVK